MVSLANSDNSSDQRSLFRDCDRGILARDSSQQRSPYRRNGNCTAGNCRDRGYVLSEEAIYIRHWEWLEKLPLETLASVEVDPHAMDNSWRVWGNGGLLSFSGRFHDRKLGFYRAYATDFQRTVILWFRDPSSPEDSQMRAIVLSPDRPEHFAEELRRQLVIDCDWQVY